MITKNLDLSSFGTESDKHKKDIEREVNSMKRKATLTQAASNEPVTHITENDEDSSYIQWTNHSPRTFCACGETFSRLKPGLYRTGLSSDGRILFTQLSINIDDLLFFPDSVASKIYQQIEDFWKREKEFEKYKFLHRRGYLFYGPAGSGKSCLVQQIVQHIISQEGIVFHCDNPNLTTRALDVFRQVEPNRKIVCLFEDIDSIIDHYGESDLLSVLDGENQINHVLNIATTNYPERLDARIVSRPRRFDRVVFIDMPSEIQRRIYFTQKLQIGNDEVENWVKETNGFSFASLAELVISVKCLGNSFEETIKELKSLIEDKAPTSSQYLKRGKTGFAISNQG